MIALTLFFKIFLVSRRTLPFLLAGRVGSHKKIVGRQSMDVSLRWSGARHAIVPKCGAYSKFKISLIINHKT